MPQNEDSLTLVKKMGSYFQTYQQFRDNIVPHLQETAKVEEDTFTSHGYSHCVRIFQHLNSLLEGHQPFFVYIKEEELFCLGLAVLLHDLIMTKQPELRRSHSKDARVFIRKEFESLKASVLVIHLHDSVVDAIADIVYAHSDPKDANDSVIERTLEIVKDSTESGGSGPLRTYVLAALLRFGDELDCTSARIYDCQKLVNKDQVGNNPHWRKCELVRSIQPQLPARTGIILKINDLILNESDDKSNDLKLINETLTKLRGALAEVNSLVFHPKNIEWWHYENIKLTDESEMLVQQLNNQDPLNKPLEDSGINNRTSTETVHKNTGIDHPPQPEDKTTCNLDSADKAIGEQLKMWVLNDKMLHSGHFKISQTRHARDWIDTSRLLENLEYFGHIVNSFISILKKENLKPEEIVLIGEGFPGLIIASQIGFIGGYGCSYVAPDDIGSNTNTYAKLPDIPKNKRIVLVTDVVAQADTLNSSLNHIETINGIAPERVAAVLTIFYRKPRNGSTLSSDIQGKLFALNTDFPIELCEKSPENCILYTNKLVDVIYESLDQ